MHRKLHVVTLTLGILCGCVSDKHASTHALSQYGRIREFLQGFTDSQSKSNVDYFFVSTIFQNEGGKVCYAYWITGNSIIVIDLPLPKIVDPIGYLWYTGKGRIDLATHVVPTKEDVGSSTYLVDSDWVASVLRDCLNSGVRIEVRKKGQTKPLG